jgi:hypoxia up-regulated 1
MRIKLSTTSAMLMVAGGLFSCASAKAILGVDLGSLYMKVALVQRGAPLEIVTNLHSKRKTEQMVLFDEGTRFFGADANGLLARKPTKTPAAMSVTLGRDEDHPAVKVCIRYFSQSKIVPFDFNARACI